MVEAPEPSVDRPRDKVRYRRVMAFASTLVLLVFGVGAAVQSRILTEIGEAGVTAPEFDVPMEVRILANLGAVVVLGLGVWLIRIDPRRRMLAAVVYALLTLLGVGARAVLQLLLGVYPTWRLDLVAVDVAAGIVAAAFSLIVGFVVADALQRARVEERERALQTLRASAALEALQTEELRVRREVAEGLHGTVQQQLVLIGVRLDRLDADLAEGEPVTAAQRAELAAVAAELERLREQDVRGMSQLLYPQGVDMGIAQATRMMLRRVPSVIAVETRIDPAVIALDDPAVGRLDQKQRLVVIRALEEGISNALRHGRAAALAVTLEVAGPATLILTVDDDGVGIAEGAELSGLGQLRARLRESGGSLELAASPLGGARLTARLPIRTGA